jgi:acyl-CoA oxidase
MSPTPQWVKDLKPSPPQGTDLIQAERNKSKISVEKLSDFLFSKEVLERQERILKILQAEKVFDKSQNYFDGRVERFKTSLARAKRLRQLQVKHKWDREDYMVANELISEPTPYGLHASMYLVCLCVHTHVQRNTDLILDNTS